MESLRLGGLGMKHIKNCRVCSVELIAGSGLTTPKGNCYPSNMKHGKRICNKCIQEYVKQKQKEYRKNKKVGDSQHLNDMLEGARQRARKNNIPFNLKIKDLRSIITDTCPILGIKFQLNKPDKKWGKGKNQNNWQTSPSLDRIVPSKGYTKDNVIIVCLMANSIKNQAEPDQIIKVGRFYKKLYKQKGLNYEKETA